MRLGPLMGTECRGVRLTWVCSKPVPDTTGMIVVLRRFLGRERQHGNNLLRSSR